MLKRGVELNKSEKDFCDRIVSNELRKINNSNNRNDNSKDEKDAEVVAAVNVKVHYHSTNFFWRVAFKCEKKVAN